MHNSLKKILLKTRTDEGESPSISPQVMVKTFSSTREPVHSVKPRTHYCQLDYYECHLRSVSVFSRCSKSFGMLCSV